MLRSSLCDYSDPYILVSETRTITGAGNYMQQEYQTKEIQQ